MAFIGFIDISGLATAFLALFIILDPFLSLVIFVGMMRKASLKQKRNAAFVATGVAFSLLIVFLLVGDYVLKYLGIDFGSFKIAGGIILLIMGVQQVLGLEFKRSHEAIASAAVVIGTPLLAGPGALSTTLIMQDKYGFWVPFIAIVLVSIITYTLLYFSERLNKLLGRQMIEIASRVLGLLLAAIAVTYVRDGVRLIITGG